MGDTGRFLFPNTSNDTLRVASELIKYDFNMSKLLDKMEIISDNIMRFRAFIFENYDGFLKDDLSSKDLFLGILEEDVLPWWESDVENMLLAVRSRVFKFT